MKEREIFAYRGRLDVQALNEVMRDKNLNAFTRAELLCMALPTALKELARGFYRNLVLIKEPGGGTPAANQITIELARLQRLGLERPLIEAMTILPSYSLGIEFPFTLARPYLSRDDDVFYIIDNPVRKDKVFKVPYMAPASWKGALRAKATRIIGRRLEEVLRQSPEAGATPEARASSLWPRRAQGVLLFGNENAAQARYLNGRIAEFLLSRNQGAPEEDLSAQRRKKREGLETEFDLYLRTHGFRTERIEGRQGRLFFFPTYFNDLGLEIINPHDRRRGVGINPILYECVPRGAQGRFSLLYVPFDFPGSGQNGGGAVTPDRNALVRQLAEDLPFLAEAVHGLFTSYGFGAKTSSGYGAAEDNLPSPGRLLLKAQLGTPAEHTCLPPHLEHYFGAADRLDDFIDPLGNLRSVEAYTQILRDRGEDYYRKKRQLYGRIKDWWETGGEASYREHQAAQSAGAVVQEFSRLQDLPGVVRQLAAALMPGGEV
ncbi:MAG: hypothetical protein FJ134_01415 [Deltaproteobacteria bacterium]|nr:hypothetical protein [Deltaproteobacteria bacterium]